MLKWCDGGLMGEPWLSAWSPWSWPWGWARGEALKWAHGLER
jgi:hypothetical protein